MKFIFALLPTMLSAQTVLTISGPAKAAPGSTMTLVMTLTGGTVNGPAAFQGTLSLPSGFTASLPVLGNVMTAAAKTVTCSAANLLCLFYAKNSTVVGNGIVYTQTVQVPVGYSGTATIAVSGIVVADKNGLAMAVPVSTTVNVPVFSIQDLNSDGVVDSKDILIITTAIIAGTACGNLDQNGDGICNILDTQLIAKVAQ